MALANSEYAVESKFSHCRININTSEITYETNAAFEPKLHFYEKVSLVFLLYDQQNNALQSLLHSTNLLSTWFKSQHTSSWQNKFVEALCVIQNYALLKILGFDKEEMKETYFPTQPNVSLYLDRVMKALYCLCEQLSVAEVTKFLEHLKNDFNKKGISMEIWEDFSENHLELYLLHCFSVKYISKNDLSNIIAILKNMSLVHKADMADMLESVLNMPEDNNNRKFDLTEAVENYANPTAPSCSENSVIGDNSIVKNVPSTKCYDIDPKNVGICLIINEKKYYKEDLNKLSSSETYDNLEVPEYDLEERTGTDVDKASLSEIFKKLGFRIIILENLNHREMIPKIEEVMKDFTRKDSCFVVCILSHGVESKIFAANSVPISINKIRETLHDRNFPALLSKPKILIIQSCQGTDIQKVYRQTPDDNEADGPSNNNLINDNAGVPEKRDLILCMSTVSGYASVRNRKEGSWYIQELCKTIDEKCEVDHFQDILILVNDKVSSRRWQKEGQGIVTMVPEATTTLSKKLYLPKIKES